MKSFRSYNANMSLQDIVMILLMSILFIIVYMKVEEPKKIDNIKTNAEFIVLVEWDSGTDDDIDTWLRDPQERIIYYKDQEQGIMHLDRDDLGMKKDIIEVDKITKIKSDINQELTTIRGFIKGEWILNLHFYRREEKKNSPANVNVKITKLNPKAKIILNKKIVLNRYWQEVTVARFYMSSNGEILEINEDFPYEMIKSKIGTGTGDPSQ